MTKQQKRFKQFQASLKNEPPKVREAAIAIVKVLDKLPNNKARERVLKAAIEKLNPDPQH